MRYRIPSSREFLTGEGRATLKRTKTAERLKEKMSA